jgi:hypothetical protein
LELDEFSYGPEFEQLHIFVLFRLGLNFFHVLRLLDIQTQFPLFPKEAISGQDRTNENQTTTYLCLDKGILTQLAAATAANGTYLATRGGARYGEFTEK